jgi:hypothetical protein
VSGTTVNVSWSAVSVAPGVPASGYRVARYDAGTGAAQTVLSGCAGVVTTTSCAENGVPVGSWRYAVRAVQGTQWTGAEGSRSSAVTVAPVAAPTITDSPASPTNQTSASFSFTDTQSGVTFECALDGAAYAACTSPKTYAGPLSAGSHSFAVRAKDGNGIYSTSTATTWTIDTTAPTATDVQSANVSGGTVGKMETGDTLTYSFSEAVSPGSVVSGWTGSARTVTVTVTKNSGATDDTLTISDGTTGPQVTALGTVNLGQKGFVNNTATSTATMVLSGTQIVVTFTQTIGKTVTTAGDMQWTPGTLTDLAGNSLGNAGSAVTEQRSGGNADVDF